MVDKMKPNQKILAKNEGGVYDKDWWRDTKVGQSQNTRDFEKVEYTFDILFRLINIALGSKKFYPGMKKSSRYEFAPHFLQNLSQHCMT